MWATVRVGTYVHTHDNNGRKLPYTKKTSLANPCPWLFCAFGTLSHRSGKNFISSFNKPSLQELYNAALTVVSSQFAEVVKSVDFISAPPNQAIDLLSSDDLNVKTEIVVLQVRSKLIFP